MRGSFRSEDAPDFRPPNPWVKRGLLAGVPAVVGVIVLFAVWNTFYRYVPPGKLMVVIAKSGAEQPATMRDDDGSEVPAQHVVADEGQKGIQRKVLGEGWHFVLPIVYTTEIKENTVVPPGKVGVVTALGGRKPRSGRILAEEEDEQGIRRDVLPPGSYRLNPYAVKVELVNATVIRTGYVGVRRRLLGTDNASRFADKDDEKGLLRDVLQPGLYYVNPREYEVIHAEVGIDQSTFQYHKDASQSTAIAFPVKDGNTIRLDCTVEWEVLPKDTPMLVSEYGTVWDEKYSHTALDGKAVERNVIDQHVRKICRDRGFNYGAQEFLEGEKREAFQSDFARELEKVCKERGVTVRSAFIRDIIIPEDFLVQKREKQLAAETRITNEAKELTAKSNADVERERRTVDQAVAEVKAETDRLVAGVDREAKNVQLLTAAEIEKTRAEYGAKIAELEAERTRQLGEAKAEAKKLTETAQAGLYKMKMDVFNNDGNAYLRYTLAKELNPKLVLRLFHAGPGTFWTNLGDKNMNLLLQPGAAPREGAGKK